jgi:hypothetical protein
MTPGFDQPLLVESLAKTRTRAAAVAETPAVFGIG